MTKTHRSPPPSPRQKGAPRQKVKTHHRKESGQPQASTSVHPPSRQTRPTPSTVPPSNTPRPAMDAGSGTAPHPPGWVERDGCWYYTTPDGQYIPWSTVPPSNTHEQHGMDVETSQARLPPGWIERNGRWYYPTPDGQYIPWNNAGYVAEYPQEADAAPDDNGEGTYVQGVDDNHAYRAWDGVSRKSNQGSWDSDSPQSTTEPGDVQGPVRDNWSREAEGDFLNGPSPWSTEGVVSHADGAAPEGYAQGYVGGYYPASLDVQAGDDEEPMEG